jgi:pyruvate ferredoxin oxidoreductase beta subunit
MEESIQMARTAVENRFWPLYEVENGVYKINHTPKEKVPVVDWLKAQGRFRHLFRPGMEGLLTQIQEEVDREWERLLKLALA